MKIDVFPHILPRAYLDRARAAAPPPAARTLAQHESLAALHDLDARFAVMDLFDDYAQVLTLAQPPIEALGEAATGRELARVANDSMAELCRHHPDRFLGFAAAVCLTDVEAALEEARRAVGELGALGVQIYTNVRGAPLDQPRFAPFFAHLAELDRTIWVHPARSAAMPDYPVEQTSRFGMWMAFGWPYETTLFMCRMALAGIFQRHSTLRLLTHHTGAMIPHLAERVGKGLDPDEPMGLDLSAATDPAGRHALVVGELGKFHVDTALSGVRHALECGLGFFGADRLLFGTDMPFDLEAGPGYIRGAIQALDRMDLDEAQRRRIYEGNARRLLGLPPSGPTRG